MSRGVLLLVFAALIAGSLPDVFAGSTASLMGVGYYVDYDAASRATVQVHGEHLDWVITTNYEVDGRGTLRGTHDATIVDAARSRGAKVQFRVINAGVSRDIVHRVLTRSNNRRRFEDGIVRILTTYGYDGVNVDLENIAPDDRPALTAFMTRLAARVHALGKSLSMAVPPKTVDNLYDDWNGAFDYAALGAVVDRLIVMAYDEHWSGSAPGPVASLSWVEAVGWFTVNNVPRGKILLGVALYGYDWPAAGAGEGISMITAEARAAQNGAAVLWDDAAQVPFYRYAGHTVYFENARSVERKLALATVLQVSGVAVWRLGHEVPATWDVIHPYLARYGP